MCPAESTQNLDIASANLILKRDPWREVLTEKSDSGNNRQRYTRYDLRGIYERMRKRGKRHYFCKRQLGIRHRYYH